MTEAVTLEAPHDRCVFQFTGDAPGPTVICIGALHGNEPAGVQALEQVREALTRDGVRRGELLGVIGNLSALGARRRYVDEDLNRIWVPELMAQPSASAESSEREALLEILEAAIHRAGGPVVLLDLHTTSGRSVPFTVFGDTLPSRTLAECFPIPTVLGFEEYLYGTLLDYVADRGHAAVLVEGGAHDGPNASDHLAAAVWIAAAFAGLVDEPRAEVARARQWMLLATNHVPPVLEVRYRHAIRGEDRFRMAEGFASFDDVHQGQRLGDDRAGEVAAVMEGLLLLPLYQSQGDDGFFVARPVRPTWLRLSRWLRRMALDRYVHLLPGVERDPTDPAVVVVNTHVARWLALQVFHLLGFKRTGTTRYEIRLRRRAERSGAG